MDVFSGHGSARIVRPVLALGNFDGVHRGHQQLLAVAVATAGQDGTPAAMTFDPHPASVLAPGPGLPVITPLPRKLELLEQHGTRAVIVEPFTLALAAVSPDSFVEDILVRGLGARAVVVGYDFTYGSKRGGTIDTLRRAGERHGFGVHVVPAVRDAGGIISSTRIRAALAAGDTAEARLLLGRPHDVDGVVVRGAGRGRQLGIPTANVGDPAGLLPRPGVYAGELTLLDGGETFPGGISLGENATFTPGAPLSLEIHLLDFDRDIYDRRVRVCFHDWIREQATFESVPALKQQIAHDLAMARKLVRR